MSKNTIINRNSIWKLNVSLLEDEDTCSRINDVIRDSKALLERTWLSPCSTLKRIESRAKQIFIEKGKQAARRQRATLDRLSHLHRTNVNRTDVKEELDEIIDRRKFGAALRARSDLIDNNLKCTIPALASEKNIQSLRTISALRTNTGRVTNSPVEIGKEIASFYSALYKCRECKTDDTCSFCLKWRKKQEKISAEDIRDEYPQRHVGINLTELELPITKEEIIDYIRSYKKKFKSPGTS
ncbi:Hypothetical protein FKW44_003912, partial [Caligus rogercresseyi]